MLRKPNWYTLGFLIFIPCFIQVVMQSDFISKWHADYPGCILRPFFNSLI